MVVQGPLDYNLLLGRDYIYCMGAIVSSLFRVMCFPHEGRVVKLVDQLSFPGSYRANSHIPSLNGLFTQEMSQSPVHSPDEREWFGGHDWNPGACTLVFFGRKTSGIGWVSTRDIWLDCTPVCDWKRGLDWNKILLSKLCEWIVSPLSISVDIAEEVFCLRCE